MTNNKEIALYISAHSFQEEDIRGKTVAVIDVLRASSTIITALHNGAKGIIPVADMDMAGKISQGMDSPNYLLCGEKNGIKIEGYHLGNSPLEYTPEVVQDKTIILNTTNGTKAVKKAVLAEQVVIAGFLNLKRIVDYLQKTSYPVVLACAGWQGRLSLEDLLCAGRLIYELYGGQMPGNVSDSVRIAFEIYKKYSDAIEETIYASEHAGRLKGIINPKDIAYCCRLNVTDVLPALSEGIISDFNDKEKEIGYKNRRAVSGTKA